MWVAKMNIAYLYLSKDKVIKVTGRALIKEKLKFFF